MKPTTLPLTPMPLEANGLAHLQPRGAACVQVRVGTVWLTIDGESDDHVLEPGQALALAPGQHAIAQALGGAASLVLRERPAPRRSLLAPLWAGLHAWRPRGRVQAAAAARLPC
jgi:Protein of unknown function (DUF2917)